MERKSEEMLRSFIDERFKVSSHKIPHYLRWISKYITFSENAPSTLNTREEFLKYLGSRYPAWQAEQAEKAMTIYQSFIRKEKNKHPYTKKTLDNTVWKNVILNMQNEMRLQNKSLQTERSYLYWANDFRRYSGSVCPNALSQDDLKAFLTYLAVERSVAIATQKQAFNAILYLFRHVLDKPITDLDCVIRSKQPHRLPLVLSLKEVSEIIRPMEHPYRLMTEIIYGGGLRLSECLRLRIKDVDFQNTILTVRSGKGDKDRQTLLSEKVLSVLKNHVRDVRKYYEDDRFHDRPGVELPRALERKYPNAGKEWAWFWVFPSARISVDPLSNIARRHHLFTSSLQKAFKKALRSSGIAKNASIHTLRHYAECRIMPSGKSNVFPGDELGFSHSA